MDSVRLTVQTVPASDPVTREMHIAYTVLRQGLIGGEVEFAPGWTLRDAIDNYCTWFQVDRCCIGLNRPFLPQRVESYDCL